MSLSANPNQSPIPIPRRPKAPSTKSPSEHSAISTYSWTAIPIPFRSEKAKELLALLVDRRGGFVSSSRGYLGFMGRRALDRAVAGAVSQGGHEAARKLEEHHAEQAIETVRGKRRVVPSTCRATCTTIFQRADDATAFRGSLSRKLQLGRIHPRRAAACVKEGKPSLTQSEEGTDGSSTRM